METKEEGKNEKTFKTFGKKVDDFVVELNEAGEKLRKEFQLKYEELKIAAEKLKNEGENKERWREVEGSLKKVGDELMKVGDELGKAFKAAFSKKQP